MNQYTAWLESLLLDLGLSENMENILHVFINLILYTIFILVVGYLLHKFFSYLIRFLSGYKRVGFLKYTKGTGLSRNFSHFIPLWVMSKLTQKLFAAYPVISNVLVILINSLLILFLILIIISIAKTLERFLNTKEQYKDKPVRSYIQVIQLFIWGVGIIALINYIAGGNIITFSALGAASAILLLIFKDTILGFVASIQISVNDMVRIGDWIEFNKHGANGYVTKISLATVTVENFDKTYSTIPTYSLISDSFKNWRGIYDRQGRRIKRAIFIKQSSIRFMTDRDLDRLKKVERVKNYIEHRQLEINRYNQLHAIDKSVKVNGRNQTNIGIFKKYIDAYLQEQTALNFNFTVMVRSLDPTPHGVPIEIYCFSKRTAWKEFEAIQGLIFDHITAAVSHFDLEIFEAPSGQDIQRINT